MPTYNVTVKRTLFYRNLIIADTPTEAFDEMIMLTEDGCFDPIDPRAEAEPETIEKIDEEE